MAFTFNESVWKLHGRQKPRRCPCCGSTKSLKYVGFAANYEPGLQAHLFSCTDCFMWVDCIWPKDISYLYHKPRTLIPATSVLAAAV